MLLALNPAAIRGLGTAGGFEVYLQDRADADPQKLYENLQQFLGALRKRPELTGIATFYRPTSPQLFVDVDREKAMALGVPVQDVFDALAEHDGRALRQRLQQVRAHLSRAAAGRGSVPRANRRTWATSTSAPRPET